MKPLVRSDCVANPLHVHNFIYLSGGPVQPVAAEIRVQHFMTHCDAEFRRRIGKSDAYFGHDRSVEEGLKLLAHLRSEAHHPDDLRARALAALLVRQGLSEAEFLDLCQTVPSQAVPVVTEIAEADFSAIERGRLMRLLERAREAGDAAAISTLRRAMRYSPYPDVRSDDSLLPACIGAMRTIIRQEAGDGMSDQPGPLADGAGRRGFLG